MNRSIIIGLSMLLCVGVCHSQERPQPQLDGLEEKVDAQVKKYLDLDIFSGIVLIARDGVPIYHKPFGLANRTTKAANTPQTRFDIGSMNKTFTKLVILKLLDDKQLKLDDKLGEHLEGFPKEVAENVEITHLLDHSSGFGDYSQSSDFFEAPASEKTIPALVDRIRRLPLHFPPGEDRQYSNSGYILLGAIIEQVTGKSYHDMVQEHILTPLEMKDTYVRDKYQVSDRAIGYFKNMKGELMDNEGFAEVPNPDGGFLSTTSDILKFYREYHYGNTLVKQKTKMKDEFFSMIQAHQTTGGAIPHAGGFNGANTVHYEILRDRISVVVFANMDEPVAEQLGVDILAIIRGNEPENPQLPARQLVYQALRDNGADYVKNNFEALTRNFHPTDPKGMILNMIGYDLMRGEELTLAVNAFRLNTELFPEDPNVWDSYGEGLLNQGKKEEALEMYKKALRIDPEFPSALTMVKKLTRN